MNATVIVRYDSSAHEETEPRLRATVDDRGVPHATFEAFRAFVYEWQATDPNGTWEPEGVHLDAGQLVYADEMGECRWNEDGAGAYALTGFPWWIEEQN